MKVILATPHNNISLSSNVMVSDVFRRNFNNWLTGFFGVDYLLKKGEVFISERDKIVIVRPEDFHRLKNFNVGEL